MNRRDILAMVGSTVALSSVSTIADVLPDTADVMSDKMPVLFVGHGNPMNAITDNAFAKQWERIGRGSRYDVDARRCLKVVCGPSVNQLS
jgi:4,5-DOPA dioxygenase extradiol